MAKNKKESKTDIIRRKREEAAAVVESPTQETVELETPILSDSSVDMIETSDDVQIASQNEDSTPSSVEEAQSEAQAKHPERKKRPPGSGRGYALAESLGILKMFNEGKSIDEIARRSGRPILSLTYKYKNPKRGYMKPKTYFDVYKAFPDVLMDEEKAEEWANEWLKMNQ